MSSEDMKRERFERLVLPHMDSAFGLAVWLLRSEAEAEEAVQEAYLRAFRSFQGFRGEHARPWLLGIVRNTCYSLLARDRRAGLPEEFNEENHGEEAVAPGAVVSFPSNPESALIQDTDRELVRACLRALPADFREALVLREIHGCSYREIASIVEAPIGTVMSRIARARRRLESELASRTTQKSTGT